MNINCNSSHQLFSPDNALVLYLNSIGILLVSIILPDNFEKSNISFKHKCEDGQFSIDIDNKREKTSKRVQFNISKSMSVISIRSSIPKIISLSPNQKYLEIKYQVTQNIFNPVRIFDNLGCDSVLNIINLDCHNHKYMLSVMKCKQCENIICTLPSNSLIYKMNFSLEDNLELFLCHDNFSALHPSYLNFEKNLHKKVNIDERYVWIHQFLLEQSTMNKDETAIRCDKCSMKLGHYEHQTNNDFIFRKYDLLKVSMLFTLDSRNLVIDNIFNKAYFHFLLQQCLIDNRHMITFYTRDVVIELQIKCNIIYTLKSIMTTNTLINNTNNNNNTICLNEIKLFNIIEYSINENERIITQEFTNSIEIITSDKEILLELLKANKTENAFEIYNYMRISNIPQSVKLYFMELSS